MSTSSQKAPSAWGSFEKHHAFVIGINAYTRGIPPLRTAAPDAIRLAELLGDPARRDRFTVHPPLIDAAATKAGVMRLLDDMQAVGPNDRVLFYFAGHGVAEDGEEKPAGYILPSDACSGNVGSFIPMSALHDALDRLRCRHLIVILDCCFSGAFRWTSKHRALSRVPKRIYRERFDRFVKDKAWQVLTSAGFDQKALDVLTQGPKGDLRGQPEATQGALHSPFALALFDAIDGQADARRGNERTGDGILTATELYEFIRDRVEQASIAAGEHLRQTPVLIQLRQHDKGEFIFLHPHQELVLHDMPLGVPPYKGLQSFDVGDHELFYGRSAVVKSLVQRHEHMQAQGQRLLVITGYSGTGKSSVMKAGLWPRLQAQGLTLLPVVRPGEDPEAALQKALATGTGPEGVLLIDQMEELITRCTDAKARQAFCDRLADLLSGGNEVHSVIVTVRQDFEPQFNQGRLGAYWDLSRFVIPPLTPAEFREVIEMPAVQTALSFEPEDLIDQIVAEVLQAPSPLPLLSYALSELYARRVPKEDVGMVMTRQAFEGMGRVVGAMTRAAEALYTSLTDPAHQAVMRRMFLRMVSVEGELAGKRVLLSDIAVSAEDLALTQHMASKLDAARLVATRDEDTEKWSIEPAHDALVWSWPLLSHWIDQFGWPQGPGHPDNDLKGRARLMLAARLHAATKEHDAAGDTSGTGSTGPGPARGQAGRPKNKDALLWDNNPNLLTVDKAMREAAPWFNLREQAFIRRSLARKTRRARVTMGVTAGVMLMLTGAGGLAWQQRNQALNEKAMARSGELASVADAAMQQDPELGALLALEAYKIAPAAGAAAVVRSYANLAQGHHVLRVPRQDIALAEYAMDGQVIVTAGKSGEAIVWDARSKRPLRALTGHHGEIVSLSISPDGKQALTGSWDGTARRWDLASGKQLTPSISNVDNLNSAAWSPDGRSALIANGNTIQVWRFGEPSPTWTQIADRSNDPLNSRVFDAHYSPTGDAIATGGDDGVARLWQASTGALKFELRGHGSRVWRVRFSPDGQTLLTIGQDGAAKLWRVVDGRLAGELDGLGSWATDAQFSADGRYIVTAGVDGRTMLWPASGGKAIKIFVGHTDRVESAQLSPDDRTVLTVSSDGTARLWDSHSGEVLSVLKGHAGPVASAKFATSHIKRVLTVGDDGTAQIWDVSALLQPVLSSRAERSDAQLLRNDQLLVFSARGLALWDRQKKKVAKELERSPFVSNTLPYPTYDLSQTERLIATVNTKHQVRLWAVGQAESSPELQACNVDIYRVKFSPDEHYLLGVSDDKRDDQRGCLWDTKSGALLHVLQGTEGKDSYSGGSPSIEFSPDSKLALITSGGPTAWLWRLDQSALLRTLLSDDGVTVARFFDQGRQIMTAGHDKVAQAWQLTGEKATALAGHRSKPFIPTVNDLVFFADGHIALTAGDDKTLRVWDVASGSEKRTLNGHTDTVTTVSMSSDGMVALSTSQDHTARLWDMASGKELQRFAQVISAHFSSDGKSVVMTSMDGGVYVLPCEVCQPAQDIASSLARTLGRTLTPQERALHGLPPADPQPAQAKRP